MTKSLLLIVNCIRTTMSTAVTSQRKKTKILYDNDAFVYVHNNSNKDATVHCWTCDIKKLLSRKVHVSDSRIIRHVGEPTHGLNSEAVKANSLLNEMVHEAETTQNTTRNIISSAVSSRRIACWQHCHQEFRERAVV